MWITKYINYNNIYIMFDDGYETTSTYSNFSNGSLISPYFKTIYKIGYLGEGKYNRESNNGKCYNYWRKMLQRCYDDDYKNKQHTYINKTVCEEWHNYQSFATWFDNYYYEVVDDRTELDKDILVKGNKIYSPNTCCFVPKRINTLFTKNEAIRGKYPIGVRYVEKLNKYQARCSIFNRNKREKERVNLGFYNNPIEAFNHYKIFKEQYIKEVAEEYKNEIPKKLYDAMCKWKVEITD